MPADDQGRLRTDTLADAPAQHPADRPTIVAPQAGNVHSGAFDPLEKVPELSRRSRAVPVRAVLRSLGRTGVADLVEGLVSHARAFAGCR